ncbi:RICIN domain-containing protein [Streptomyces sp. NPDC096339]|uniref:RICIN domain-containing protein n=1 Tax=Streptomyces sp. NPDC096339 TaxID=3366086 RepID=UPI00382EA651
MIKRSWATFGSIAAVVAMVIIPAPSASAGGFTGEIRNKNSGRCLEIADWSTANGAVARQWSCTGGANQKWTYDLNTGYIKNANSGLCLEIADWSTANGAVARQWSCTGGANQKWDYLFYSNDTPYFGLANQNSDRVLEIADWSTANGAIARQWGLTGGANQKWL